MRKNSIILLNALPDKKTKSIGNRCMVDINDKYNILDYHISYLRKIFHNPEIVVVCGFDTKKIKKYIATKYKNVIYVEHHIDDFTNAGQSVRAGLDHISTRNCLILNSNHILQQNIIHKLKKNIDSSFVCYSNTKGDIGYIQENNYITNCYYGLPKNIYDIVYMDRKQIEILLSLTNISKLYLFEIINECINNGLKIKPLEIPQKSVITINNIKNIERIKKNLCLI